MNNKVWYYKGNVYRVIKYPKMKNADGSWVGAVNYTDVNKEGSDYVRSESSFHERFIPSELSNGDLVAVISHGKLIAVQPVTISESGNLARLPDNGLAYIKTILRGVQSNGFISRNQEIWEYYYYNETTCKMLGIEFKKN